MQLSEGEMKVVDRAWASLPSSSAYHTKTTLVSLFNIQTRGIEAPLTIALKVKSDAEQGRYMK